MAPMLAKLGYDPKANPPNYGTPDGAVANNTAEVTSLPNRRPSLVQDAQPRQGVGGAEQATHRADEEGGLGAGPGVTGATLLQGCDNKYLFEMFYCSNEIVHKVCLQACLYVTAWPCGVVDAGVYSREHCSSSLDCQDEGCRSSHRINANGRKLHQGRS